MTNMAAAVAGTGKLLGKVVPIQHLFINPRDSPKRRACSAASRKPTPPQVARHGPSQPITTGEGALGGFLKALKGEKREEVSVRSLKGQIPAVIHSKEHVVRPMATGCCEESG